MMEIFCENNQLVAIVTYFRKKRPILEDVCQGSKYVKVWIHSKKSCSLHVKRFTLYIFIHNLLIFRKHFKILFYLRINCAKCPNTEFFLVHIFLYSDWIQRFTVNICIQSEYRKIQTKKNSAFGQFSRSDALTR